MKPPIVSVLYYHGWPAHLLSGLRRQGIDNKIVWINHLPDNDVRREYLDSNTTVIRNPRGYNTGGHGGGIDAGVQLLRKEGYSHFLHVEPDCTTSGREWYEDLLRASANGAELAGPCVQPHGLIHPCVSLWRLDAARHSFTVQPKVQMPDPKHFDHRGQVEWLAANKRMDALAIWLLTAFWDCGLLNAYEARRRGKAVQTTWEGIEHHWEGRSKPAP